METLFKDISYGIRNLIKRPGFFAVALRRGEWRLLGVRRLVGALARGGLAPRSRLQVSLLVEVSSVA